MKWAETTCFCNIWGQKRPPTFCQKCRPKISWKRPLWSFPTISGNTDFDFFLMMPEVAFLFTFIQADSIFMREFGSASAESCQMSYLLNHSLSRGVKLYTSTKYFLSFSLTSYSFMNRTKILCLSYDKKDFKFGIFLQEIFQ